MANINRVELSGNICREPVLRTVPTGVAILSFAIGVTTTRRDRESGEWVDCPNYFDCVMFGPRAEGLKSCLSKGVKVALCGELRWRSWDQEGSRRSKVEVVVDVLDFISRRRDAATRPEVSVPGTDGYEEPAMLVYADSDIPF